MSNTTIRQPTGFIRVDGTKLVDGDGNEIILRGAGLGGWMKYVQRIYSFLTVLQITNFTTQ